MNSKTMSDLLTRLKAELAQDCRRLPAHNPYPTALRKLIAVVERCEFLKLTKDGESVARDILQTIEETT